MNTPSGLARFQKAIVSKRSGRCHFCDQPTAPETDFAVVNGGGKWIAVCSTCALSETEQCKALVRTITAESETLELTAEDRTEIQSFFPADLAAVLSGNVEKAVAIAAVIKLGDALATLRTFAPEDDIVAALRAVATSKTATEWERDFATSLVRQIEDGRTLSDKQRAIADRIVNGGGKAAPKATALDLSHVPAGIYAVPGGDTRLKVKIDKPEKGKWAGFVFVKDGAEYGEQQRYGMQRPGQTYSGKIEDALRIIAADFVAAAKAYAAITGCCSFCKLPLEDERSVEAGYGPVCASKRGLPWG
jgi:hypothetical protein